MESSERGPSLGEERGEEMGIGPPRPEEEM